MTTPNFTRGTGRLALDRYDAQSHFNGTNFRHTADQIDIKNPTLVYGDPSTVEQALEDLNSFITITINNGVGFVAVPDGYNTYHNANGTINFDTTIPSLDTFLNPLFASIIQIQAGTAPTIPLPPGFSRIQYGGVVLIKAGTYIVANTINVPPGITLLGEGFGTKIVNATSLNTSVLPPIPKVSPTPAPVFKILADPNRTTGPFADDVAIDPNIFIFQRETRIMNMVVSDNFVEPTELGDTFYKLPQNLTKSITLNPPPLILQQLGSSLLLHNMAATGRVNFSSGQVVSQVTGSLLATDGYTFYELDTICKIDNCFIDGFSIPIDYSKANAGDGYDYIEIKNSKIRGYGYYNGDSTDGYANTIVKSYPQNISISSSSIYGNASNITSLLYLIGATPSPNKQARSKIIVANNQITINKLSNLTNNTWKPVYFDSTITVPNNIASLLIYGNAFQDTFDIYANAGSGFSGPGLGTPFISVDGYNDLATITTANGLTINGPVTLNGAETVSGSGSISVSGSLITQGSATLNVSASSNTTINIGGGSTFNSLQNSKLFLDGYVAFATRIVASNYSCDSAGSDRFILVNSGGGAYTITLPPANSIVGAAGRTITIIDYSGNAGANTIGVTTSVGQTINGASGTFNITKARGSFTVVSDGVSNWSIIAGYNYP